MPLRYIDTQQEWKGEAIGDIVPSAAAEELWSDEELAAMGLERFTPPPPEAPSLPAVPPLERPLQPVQFQAMLRLSGKYDEIMAAVAQLPAQQRAVVEAKIEYSLAYWRSNPLFDTLGQMVNLTSEDIDALWLQALEIN